MRLRCLVVALALKAAFASDSWGQSKQPPSSANAQSKQATQPPEPDQRGTDQSPLAIKILPAQDAEKQAGKQERERQEKELNEKKVAFDTQRIADYTWWLASITGFLFVVAVLQAGLFTWQLARMRRDWISNNRPRIVIRSVDGPFTQPNGWQFVRLNICNTGSSIAIVQELGGDLARRKDGLWLNPGAGSEPTKIDPTSLISGQRHHVIVVAKVVYPDTALFEDVTTDGIELCAFGAIRYADQNGVVRENGFFRVLDPKSQKFLPSQDQGEEYQD
jgi:hypothetical protein